MAKDLFEKNKLVAIAAVVVVVALIAVGVGVLLSGGGGSDNGYETPAEDIGKNVVRYNYKITFDSSFTSKDGDVINAGEGLKFAFFEYRLINSSIDGGIALNALSYSNYLEKSGSAIYEVSGGKHQNHVAIASLNIGDSYTSVSVFEVSESSVAGDFTPVFKYPTIEDIIFKLDGAITV